MSEIDSRYGAIRIPDIEGDLICRALTEHGEWAFTEQELLASMLVEGDIFWDGGAFLGTFGLGVAQIAHRAGRAPGRLLAIEPGREVLPILEHNLKGNCPCPWQIADVAVSEAPIKLRVRTDVEDDGNLGARAYQPVSAWKGADETIDGQPLRSLREAFGDYTCLKLDVEGMETAALAGDFEYIQTNKPLLWIECNEDLASVKIHDTLSKLGYDPVFVAFPAFRADNFNRNADLIYPMAYEAALVAGQSSRLDDLASAVGSVAGEIIFRPVPTAMDLRQALWATPRWSMPEWANMSRPELIAVLGRTYRKEKPEKFL